MLFQLPNFLGEETKPRMQYMHQLSMVLLLLQYSGTSLLRTPLKQLNVNGCPHFRGSIVHSVLIGEVSLPLLS